MDNFTPTSYLPHRFPFLFLDRLVDLEPGVRAVALTRVSGFPDGLPQILMVECIAQLGGIITIRDQGTGGFIASVDHAEFSGHAVDGDTLTVSARVVKEFGRLFMMSGSVECDGRVLLCANVTLGVGSL